MDVFHFSEQPYPDAWELGLDSLRNTIPNRLCDPEVARRIYHERQDEWFLCDELGINIAFNEHHASATCISASPEVTMSIMARMTQKAQILPIGFQVANRPNPLLLAEQIAMADVISGGRVQIGLVKGAPYELSPANSNPGRYMERFWEGVELIVKALSTRDGPFNFEGDYYHYRQANIWPQPWQQPHPPIWVPAQSIDSTVEIARRGYNLAVFLAGRNLKKLMDVYRKTAVEAGHPQPGPEKFGYLCLCAVGETEEVAHRRAHEIHGYLRTTGIIGEAYINPPGYMSISGNMKWLRKGILRGRAGDHFPASMKDGTIINQATASIPELVDANIVFAGTPDQVYEQICEFNDHVGGVGTFVMMFHGGTLSHEETKANLRLFAKEVLPRLKERYPATKRLATVAA
jgi:alkanesulfonate monooxygenase SsuD/methylene tetrahydromethanopterin reductase-like flavin-dependent oxidoreductase (luciferase family)